MKTVAVIIVAIIIIGLFLAKYFNDRLSKANTDLNQCQTDKTSGINALTLCNSDLASNKTQLQQCKTAIDTNTCAATLDTMTAKYNNMLLGTKSWIITNISAGKSLMSVDKNTVVLGAGDKFAFISSNVSTGNGFYIVHVPSRKLLINVSGTVGLSGINTSLDTYKFTDIIWLPVYVDDKYVIYSAYDAMVLTTTNIGTACSDSPCVVLSDPLSDLSSNQYWSLTDPNATGSLNIYNSLMTLPTTDALMNKNWYITYNNTYMETNGVDIIISPIKTGSNSQIWRFYLYKSGSVTAYLIQNVFTKLFIFTNGTLLQTASTVGPNSQWKILSKSNITFNSVSFPQLYIGFNTSGLAITSTPSSFVLINAATDTSIGNRVVLLTNISAGKLLQAQDILAVWGTNSDKSSLWELIPVGTEYMLLNVETKKYLAPTLLLVDMEKAGKWSITPSNNTYMLVESGKAITNLGVQPGMSIAANLLTQQFSITG